MSPVQLVVIILFLIGATGDAYTTFIGIVGGLGGNNNTGTLLFAGMGTAVVTGVNLLTVEIWKRNIGFLVPIWIIAVSFDGITSFAGSAKFVTVDTGFALYLRIVITLLITVSPCTLYYFLRHPLRD
jgi:hypothetical protein